MGTLVGGYVGGRLWVCDPKGTDIVLAPNAIGTVKAGGERCGRWLGIADQWPCVDGSQPHMVEEFSGERISVIFYTVSLICHQFTMHLLIGILGSLNGV